MASKTMIRSILDCITTKSEIRTLHFVFEIAIVRYFSRKLVLHLNEDLSIRAEDDLVERQPKSY